MLGGYTGPGVEQALRRAAFECCLQLVLAERGVGVAVQAAVAVATVDRVPAVRCAGYTYMVQALAGRVCTLASALCPPPTISSVFLYIRSNIWPTISPGAHVL